MSMFVVLPSQDCPPAIEPPFEPLPIRVKTYTLEDESESLGRPVFEYDWLFEQVPQDLDFIIMECLHAARLAGATVAWFAFEGSFDFVALLTEEAAGETYAVADSEGVSLASDDTLSSESWKERVARAGRNLRDNLTRFNSGNTAHR